jgi:hypothetical protein
MRILLAIPKNLVYVFVLIILFAFGCMCWITYTERDLSDFLAYDHSAEVVIVDPVLSALTDYMHLDEYKLKEINMKEYSEFYFFDEFLSENRPCVLRGYAKDWNAVSTWGDLKMLGEKAPGSLLRVSELRKTELGTFSERGYKLPATLTKIEQALELV